MQILLPAQDEIKPPLSLLECGLHLVIFFQSKGYGKGENRISQWTDLANTASARWSNLMSSVTSHIETMWPRYNVMRTALCPCSLPPQKLQPQSNHEKNIRHIPVEGRSTTYLICSPLNYQGPQKQGIQRDCHNLGAPKEAWQLNIQFLNEIMKQKKRH